MLEVVLRVIARLRGAIVESRLVNIISVFTSFAARMKYPCYRAEAGSRSSQEGYQE
jgi:hypothetical protein